MNIWRQNDVISFIWRHMWSTITYYAYNLPYGLWFCHDDVEKCISMLQNASWRHNVSRMTSKWRHKNQWCFQLTSEERWDYIFCLYHFKWHMHALLLRRKYLNVRNITRCSFYDVIRHVAHQNETVGRFDVITIPRYLIPCCLCL